MLIWTLTSAEPVDLESRGISEISRPLLSWKINVNIWAEARRHNRLLARGRRKGSGRKGVGGRKRREERGRKVWRRPLGSIKSLRLFFVTDYNCSPCT